MSRFDICLAFVLEREGGYVDDPDDPGGATNRGITQTVYDGWRFSVGAPTRPVREATPNETEAIYRERYWLLARCDDIPAPLDRLHFDSAVNLGVGTANKLLQTALGMPIVDGVIGPKTLAALQVASPVLVFGRYAHLRLLRYVTIATLDERRVKFLQGWIRRMGELLRSA